MGAKIELLSVDRLKSKFPWINTQGLVLGTHGVQDEGWFDPWALLTAFKNKAQSLGVNYINGNIIGFNLRSGQTDDNSSQKCNEVIVRQSDGTVDSITFSTGIVCCGAFSANIAQYLGYGAEGTGVRAVALPVEPRFCSKPNLEII